MDRAFSGCTGLTSVTIPAGVTGIGMEAFEGCTGLTSVTIPAGVTGIGAGAFSGCASLSAITVNAANTAYSSAGGVLFNKAQTTLVQYPAGHSGVSYTIPGSVASIRQDAFYGSSSLASVTIPAGVTSIGNYAFSTCPSLTSVSFGTGSNVASFGYYAFPEGSSGNGGDSLKTAYQAANPKSGTYRRASGAPHGRSSRGSGW
jgi:hypothetical protein